MSTDPYPDLMSVLDPSCLIRVYGKTYPQGKVYRIDEPSVRLGLEMITLLADEENEMRAAAEVRFIERLVGPVWNEWNDDRVGHTAMIHAGRTVLIYYGISPSKALVYAAGGPSPGERIRPRWTMPSLWSRSIFRRPARTDQATPVAAR